MEKFISVLILFLFSVSCATVPYEKTMSGILDTYMGEDAHTVIMELGPPNQIYSDGADGRILHWQETSRFIRPGMDMNMSTGNVQANWNEYIWAFSSQSLIVPPQYIYNTRYIQFYINSDNEIYHWRHNRKSAEEIRIERENSNLTWLITLTGITAMSIAAISQIE